MKRLRIFVIAINPNYTQIKKSQGYHANHTLLSADNDVLVKKFYIQKTNTPPITGYYISRHKQSVRPFVRREITLASVLTPTVAAGYRWGPLPIQTIEALIRAHQVLQMSQHHVPKQKQKFSNPAKNKENKK